MSEQPDSALVAAQRIHDRNERYEYPDPSRHDYEDAGVVVERIRLAAEHLARIIDRSAPSRPHHDPGDDYRDALAALAALVGGTDE